MNAFPFIDTTFLIAGLSGFLGLFVFFKQLQWFPVIFFLSLATTAFLRFDISGMAIFPYFFTTVFIFVLISPVRFIRLFSSKIFMAFAVLIFWTLLVSIWRENTDRQIIASCGLHILLLMIGAATAIILLEKQISVVALIDLMFIMLAVNGILGLLQYVTGTLALNDGQKFFLNYFSRPSGLFPEPDALGKFSMAFTILLMPLTLGHKKYSRKRYKIILLLGFFIMLISHTRSAWLGFAAGTFTFFSLSSAKWNKKIILSLLLTAIISVGILMPDYFGLGQRLGSISSIESIQEDNSGRYRLQTIRNAIVLLNSTSQAWTVGLGWFEQNIKTSNWAFAIPSNLFLLLIFRSGIIGLLICCLGFLRIIYIGFRHKSRETEEDFMVQGLPCATTAALASSMVAPMWFDPILWLLIGMGIFFELCTIKSPKTLASQ